MSAFGGKATQTVRVASILEAWQTCHISKQKLDALSPHPQRPAEIDPSGIPSVWGQFLSACSAMCGRFTNRLTWREIVALYRLAVPLEPERNLPARYNICPTDTIDAVIERGSKRDLVSMRWGLIPNWWKKTTKEMPATFNARAETVATKPMFRDALKRSRCLIPASGYYEWLPTPTGKQPYYYTSRDGSPLTFAGLWDEWKDIGTGEPLKSCTMIVTNANDLARKIHDRMPVLLQPKDFDSWLAGTASTEVLKPAANDYLQAWPVSRRVNSSRAPSDDPTLIEQITR